MRRRFEHRFDLMMGICPIFQPQMKRDSGIHRKRTEEFLRQTRVIFTAALLRKFRLKPQERTAADIHRRKRQTFVHGNKKAAETGDTGLIAESFSQSLPQYDAGILHRMVAVHLQIPFHANRQAETSMYRKGVQHVVEKANPGGNGNVSPIETKLNGNVRLLCGSLRRCLSHFVSSSAISSPNARKNAAFSSSFPAVTRR